MTGSVLRNATRFFIINRNPKQIRAAWSEEDQKWYFSVVDVIEALTGTDRPRKYRNDLKTKLHKEGSQLSEKIGPEY